MFGLFKRKEKQDIENVVLATPIPQEETVKKIEPNLIYHIHLSNGRFLKVLMTQSLIKQLSESRSGALVLGEEKDEKIIEKVVYLDQVTHITLERK